MDTASYKRVVLKLSGESLAGDQGFGIDLPTVDAIAAEVKKVRERGIDVAVVVGGGNIWRGLAGSDKGMDRAQADYMGMLATVMNSLALQSSLENIDVDTRVQSAIEMRQIAEPYIRRKAVRHLEKGRVVILAAGTGNPYFSTDTTAALRAAEIEADVILMAKKGVDGVYDSDPRKNPAAKKFSRLAYMEVLNRGLAVMDSTATSLCMDNEIPIVVFNIDKHENILKAAVGEDIGTIVGGRSMIKDIFHVQEERMKKTLEALRRDFGSLRAGRATPALLDRVMVDYYGQPTPVSQVATIAVPEPRMLMITPWEKTILHDIEKAIMKSDLGLTPNSDGTAVRLSIPQLTQERRTELVKSLNKKTEDAKVAIRNIRRDANEQMKKLEKAKEITEDEAKKGQDDMQKLVDKYIKAVDDARVVKEKEIMEV